MLKLRNYQRDNYGGGEIIYPSELLLWIQM